MQWDETLKHGIQEALVDGARHTIALHDPSEHTAARSIALAVCQKSGGDPRTLQFVVVPDSMRDIINRGFVDPPDING